MATTEKKKITKAKTDRGGRQILAQIVLTPAESKKIIAKAIARLDVIRQAADKGTVALHPSSSTYFKVEEITLIHSTFDVDDRLGRNIFSLKRMLFEEYPFLPECKYCSHDFSVFQIYRMHCV